MDKRFTFRTWTSKEMIYFKLGDDLPANWSYWDKTMQNTGLLDKNKKEIYEGDIVKYDIQGHTQAEPLMVDHENLIIGLNHDDSYYAMDEESFEIIGNIYENKELLK